MYKPQEVENEILVFWKKKKIFDKLRKQNKDQKRWSFIDGPITANNPMGVHHAWGRTYKDLFHRFKAMQGFDMRYQNGFDCQGLWVEREEEKELGLKTKDDIEKFGILKFVKSCKKRVEKFSNIQTEQSIRLGQWMDWDNSYYTHTDNNILHNWFLLKEYFKRGWLYKGNDSVPWCWRCGTASSKHDIVTEGYQEVTHKALFMKFPVKGKKKEYFLIFTTTPWTVPANVAIAVNENIVYVRVEQEEKSYWLAKSRLSELEGNYKIRDEIKGKELKGVKYDMPYSKFKTQKDSPHEVVLWDLASEDEGTGIVHIAPGCGSEDHDLGKKLDFPAPSPLDDAGIYKEDYGNFSSKKYSVVNKEVLKDLEERDFVYKIESIRHRYPHCWRCGEELVFRLVDEWYIKSKDIRKKLIKENNKIKWFPKYGKTRQDDWFNNMSDWLISRKRYWGLPLPVWECECGEIEVIGGLKELRQKAIDKKKVDSLPELHRPWIDAIKIKCKKCDKEVERIKDVGDAWLDAGIVPLSTLNYLTDKNYWKKWFPADMISENMPGQYRGWFNALFWASVTITGNAPFKSLLGYETLKDEKGEEMHKSKGNAIWFDDAVEKIGADVMRLLYCLQDPAQELKFGFKMTKDLRNDINVLHNIRRLIEDSSGGTLNREDVWIISKLHSLIRKVTDELNNLHPHLATRAIKEFWLKDFSRGYIRIIRDRLNDDESAKSTLREVYITLVKLCAPIIPFVTEAIWQDLKNNKMVNEKSVHLSEWPKYDVKKINVGLEGRMTNTLQIIEKGLAERDRAKIGLRWPLKKITIYIKGKENFNELKDVIKNQLNVKEIEFLSPASKGTEFALELDTNSTPELEAEGYARELARKVQAFRKKIGLEKTDKIELQVITDDDFADILNTQADFIQSRTNSNKLDIVTSGKERFKNKTDFSIREKRGQIAIK